MSQSSKPRARATTSETLAPSPHRRHIPNRRAKPACARVRAPGAARFFAVRVRRAAQGGGGRARPA
eukprot:4281723-Prymnesium_polylepis.1